MADLPVPGEPLLVLRCACGWETIGTEDEVIAAAGEHGMRVHNMRSTREEILATARPMDEAGRPAGPGGHASR